MPRPLLNPDPGPTLDRIYDGLPEHYRTADEELSYPLYRWLAGICAELGDLDMLRRRIDYVPGVAFTSPVVAATNLLSNPGFEVESTDLIKFKHGFEVDEGGIAAPGLVLAGTAGGSLGWGDGPYNLEPDAAPFGGGYNAEIAGVKFASITLPGANDTWFTWNNWTWAQIGKYYTLSGWARRGGGTGAGHANAESSMMWLRDGVGTEARADTTAFNGNGWKRFRVSLQANNNVLQPRFYGKSGEGPLWDAIRIEEGINLDPWYDHAPVRGWTPSALGAPIARDTTEALTGAASLRVKSDAAGKGVVGNDYIAALPGQTFTVSVWVKGTGSVKLQLLRQPSATVVAESPVTAIGDDWRQIIVTGIAPASTTHVHLAVLQQTAGAQTFWIDNAQLSLGLDAEGFTGDTLTSDAADYLWTGTPNASPSTRVARTSDSSDLTDPRYADAVWLPWLAQHVGARLKPSMTEQQARDAIQYAAAGWRAGTKAAVADAAKSALTGTQYAQVYDHSISVPGNGGQWDVMVVTRGTETPDAPAVLAAIVAAGAKPAGVVLWHRSFESSWTTFETAFTSWTAIEAAGSWDKLQEQGI